MKIELINMEEFISLNKIPEITNPVLFAKGAIPTEDGLLSTKIFGSGTYDRKTIFGYIDLKVPILHPFIYKLLKRVDRRIISIIHGTESFRVEDGKLIKDDENGWTGIQMLYKHWDSIKFERNESYMRDERINVLDTHDRDTIFMKKFVVCPPFYRDVNFGLSQKGRISHNELTDKYAKLIRYARAVEKVNTFDFVVNSNIALIQEQVLEIYNLIQNKLAKKKGMIRKRLMGKTINYGSRLVISAPVYKAETPEELPVNFTTSGLPLAYCCSLFTPFVVKWVRDFFRRELVTGGKYMAKDKDGNISAVELDDPEGYFNDDFIIKSIDHFIATPEDRFEPIQLPTKDKTRTLYFTFVGRVYNKSEPGSTISRLGTWTDVLYQACYDVTQNKHVIDTRFPVNDYYGMVINKIHVMSTEETFPIMIGDRIYKHYPIIEIKNKTLASTAFVDTLRMSNHYLKGLGGDYDGDQMSSKGLFTVESNEEAERLMHSPANLFNIAGENMRSIGNEAIQTLYALTKD